MTYDRIIILAAGVKDANGRFPEVKDGIYLGGQTRMDAARLLCNRHPDTQFVVVGGHSETSAGASDTSDKVRDMMEYLMSASPKAKLEPVLSLPCTHHNFAAVLNAWRGSGSIPGRVGILSNQYHLPRAAEFAKRCLGQLLPSVSVQFAPIAAETVLNIPIGEITRNYHREYAERLKREHNGLLRIRSNSYSDYCLTRGYGRLAPVIKQRPHALLTPGEIAMLPRDG